MPVSGFLEKALKEACQRSATCSFVNGKTGSLAIKGLALWIERNSLFAGIEASVTMCASKVRAKGLEFSATTNG